MDQEKETKQQAERCRALAQRVVRELSPVHVQVLGGSGAHRSSHTSTPRQNSGISTQRNSSCVPNGTSCPAKCSVRTPSGAGLNCRRS